MSGYFVVIGGSSSHEPFVLAAKALGFQVVVFDLNTDCPCAALVDKFFNLSTYDLKGIKDVCEELGGKARIKGIITYSSADKALKNVAELCRDYGLPSFSPEAVEACLDKDKMLRLWEGEVPVPISCAYNDVEAAVKDTKFDGSHSKIVKPSTGTQGSLGVSLVYSKDEFRDAFSKAQALSSDGVVIVEDFCEGRQFSVDGIVIKGEPRILAVSEKFTLGKEGGFVIKGFAAGEPAPDDAELSGKLSEIKDTAIKAAHTLGIDNSFFSVDLILTARGAVVIECGVLLDAKIDRLLSFQGTNVYEMICKVASGTEPEGFNELTEKGVALVFVFANRAGKLELAEQQSGDGYLVEWERRGGDTVRPPESIADTIGWVIATGMDQKDAYEKALQISEGLSFKVV